MTHFQLSLNGIFHFSLILTFFFTFIQWILLCLHFKTTALHCRPFYYQRTISMMEADQTAVRPQSHNRVFLAKTETNQAIMVSCDGMVYGVKEVSRSKMENTSVLGHCLRLPTDKPAQTEMKYILTFNQQKQ